MSRRNILVMIADDHRYESIGANGNRHVHTPHLDALSAAGTVFEGAHCQGSMHPAVCVPSRASLMTGRNIFASSEDPSGSDYEASAFSIPSALATFPERLRALGYTTHAVGKWHNDRASFARSFTSGDRLMFGGMSDHDRVPLNRFDPSGRYPANAVYFEAGLSTDLFRSSAEAFLRANDPDVPFCLYVAFTAPHDPRTPPPEHRFSPEGADLPPNLMPVHPFDNGEMLVRDELLEAFPRRPDAVRQHIADYYGMISHLDSAVGSILATLRATRFADNTLVIYTADHGLALGQHGLMGKQNLYEHSLRIPLDHGGARTSRPADACRISSGMRIQPPPFLTPPVLPDPDCEGSSLLPLAKGLRGPIRPTFSAAYRFSQRMVRDDRYKLIRYFDQEDQRSAPATPAGAPTPGSNAEQLFDLVQDPHETTNLVFLPELQEVRTQTACSLTGWRERAGDPLQR